MSTAQDDGPRQHPLALGASPKAIRAALLPDDRDAFDVAYNDALDAARTTLDLAALMDVVEQWRRFAVLQADPANFARVARRTAELRTREPVPADEPLSVTRARARL